jgi:hypothetical protein
MKMDTDRASKAHQLDRRIVPSSSTSFAKAGQQRCLARLGGGAAAALTQIKAV